MAAVETVVRRAVAYAPRSAVRHARPRTGSTGAGGVGTGRAGAVVGTTLLTLLLVVLTALVAAVTVVPRVIGAVPLTVLTGSMQPTYNPGDLIVVQPTAPEAIAVGDVVTFQPTSDNPALVTHRVIEVRPDAAGGVSGFVTQGDANTAIDKPIVADQVMGRVVYSVPLIGHITHAAVGPQLAAVAGVALLGYGLGTVAIASRAERRTRRQEDRP